jgi:3-oxoacyl-[acyl-carrier-protein] synthase III
MYGFETRANGSVSDPCGDDGCWTPRAESSVRIVGAGAYVPPHVVTAKDVARAFPGWTADHIVEKTGVLERRYLWPLDVEKGRGIVPPLEERTQPATGSEMGEVALVKALKMASIQPRELDFLIVVTCSPDEPRFSHDAMQIQRRIGMRRNAHCLVFDSGCGGTMYAMDLVARMLDAGAIGTAAIVGTNFASAMLDREVYSQQGGVGEDGKAISPYLTAYVFGDGASAVVLRRGESSSVGIRASIAGNDSQDLVRSPGGGALSPPYGPRYRPVDHAFIVDGRFVATTYFKTMGAAMASVIRKVECPLERVERFYLHQANRRILSALVDRAGLREDQVASNVARVGNTSSAGMFMLLAEDLETGRVALGSGAPVVFAAIGAGVHYGAQFVHL